MGDQQPADPRIGSVVHGRYEILRLIAEGAMGAVYEGVRVQIGRPVAVKFLHRAYASKEDWQRRFEREAIAMSKLSHPNCVSVIDFGVDDGPYIVMDLVRGRTLRELIDEDQLSVQRCLPIMGQTLAGLGHAHDNQLVHRDIKPANVAVDRDDAGNDYVQVLDFGLAKLTDPDADQLTEEGIVAGTTTYMSPEHAFGEGIDSRSDLYSAAVVFYEMLTGKTPFQAETAAGMLLAHRDKAPPPLKETNGERHYSQPLEQVITKALAKDKDERFQSADEFIAALSQVPEASGRSDLARVGPLSRSETRRVSWRPSSWASVRGSGASSRRTRLALGGGVALLAVVGLAVALAGSPSGSDAARARQAKRAAPEPKPVAAPEVAPSEPSTEPVDPAAAARAEQFLMRGEFEAARVQLEKLIALQPQNPELHYLVGTAYFEGRRWADGLASYAAAIHYDPEYKSRPLLNRNVIRALRSRRTEDQARELVLQQLQLAALPHLRDYLEHSRDEDAKQQLQELIDRLDPPLQVAEPAPGAEPAAEGAAPADPPPAETTPGDEAAPE